MPLITETYYLSLTQDNRGILRLRCSQDDTLRTVNLKLYNNGSIFVIPSGISAYVSGVKQNGAVFSKSCTISQDRESVIFQLSSDITSVDGIIVAEIVLNDGNGGRLGASNFIIQVEKNPTRAGVVQDNETPIEYINDFITQIQALTARLNNLITPNGDASLAEVIDARISSLDGHTYQNLKARIDADIATLNTGKANKSEVYTKSQVDDLLANIEIDVDNEFSDESENPVQNKVINRVISQIKADLDSLMEPKRLDDGTDLDTIKTPGVYTIHTNGTYIHMPTSGKEHGILEVWHEDINNVGRTFQRLTYTYKAGRTNIEIWVRSFSATALTWNEWISVVNLGSFKASGGADKYFSNVKVYGSPANIGIGNIRNNYGPDDAKQTGFAIFPTTTDTEWGSAIKNVTDAPISGHFKQTLGDGRTYEFDYDLSGLTSGTRDIISDAAHVIKKECFYDVPVVPWFYVDEEGYMCQNVTEV